MLASSTIIIFASKFSGVLLITLCTVRSSAVAASLWKQMITDVAGRSCGYLRAFSSHLKEKKWWRDVEVEYIKSSVEYHNIIFNKILPI